MKLASVAFRGHVKLRRSRHIGQGQTKIASLRLRKLKGKRDEGAPRLEVRHYRGEAVALAWYQHDDGPVVRDVVRLGTDGDRVSGIRYHFFSPDVLAEVCRELGVPWRSNGYRYWPITG